MMNKKKTFFKDANSRYSYLKNFQTAQLNLYLLIREESLMSRSKKSKNQFNGSA
jgi:hypothetical protein